MNLSDGNIRESLTSQQRNLLLAQPISRLSIERRVIFKDDPTIADRLDVQYLALSAVDFVMERSAVESGASPGEIVEHVAAEATRVKPSLTDEQSRKVGQVVLDYLANARDGHKAFRIEYYDAGRGGYSFHDFRLLALSMAADGSARFKLGRGAQILTLAMLDVAPEFAQEAEAIMIRKAVERGRFKDARTLAQRARMRSIHYQQFIEDRLFQVRRAADRVVWSEEVLPELDEARTHLSERRKHETAIIESIREHVANARGDTRDHLVDLRNTIDECRQRHADLFERVMTASEEFRRIQANAFRARHTQNVPDLEERILVPLLASPMRAVSCMSDGGRDRLRSPHAAAALRSGDAVRERHPAPVPPRPPPVSTMSTISRGSSACRPNSTPPRLEKHRSGWFGRSRRALAWTWHRQSAPPNDKVSRSPPCAACCF